MVFNIGGMKVVLRQRGINTDHLKGDQMREILRNHDFKNETPMILQYLEKGHKILPIELSSRIKSDRTRWVRPSFTPKPTVNTILTLRKNVNPGLGSVTLQNIQNFHRKGRGYMFAYFEGHGAGKQLEDKVKLYKSHGRVGVNA